MAKSENPDLIVVGAGPCGLSTAWFAQQAGQRVLLLEAEDQPGGRMRSVRERIGHRGDACVIEQGPVGWIGASPALEESVAALGLQPIESEVGDSHRYLIHRDRLVPFPQSAGALLRSAVLGPREKIRAAAEPWADFAPDDNEETAFEFFRRRFGEGFARKVAGPVISGLFAADPETMSITAALPEIAQAELKYGSVVKAMKRHPQLFGAKVRSFAGGMSDWSEAVVRSLGEGFRPSTPVDSVVWEAGWWFVYQQGRVIASARQLAVALPVHQTAYVLRQFLSEGENSLDRFRGNGLASVSLLYPREQVADACAGFGILAPLDHPAPVLSVQFAHAIFPQHVPESHLLLRCLLGGERFPGVLEQTQDELVSTSVESVQTWVGARERPERSWVRRVPGGVAHIGLGHAQAVAAVAAELDPMKGLHLGGDAFVGTGIIPAIERGREIAAALDDPPR